MSVDSWTNMEDVETFLQRFVQSREFPRTLVLSGDWGVGKTYLWNRVLKSCRAPAKPNYAYVSLFGVQTLDDLRDRVFEELRRTEVRETADAARQANSRAREIMDAIEQPESGAWMRFIHGALPKRWVGAMKYVPALRAYGPLYRSVAFSTVRDSLICLDDLERRGSELRIKDVLGLVSFLKETRDCKVLVILNEGQLRQEEVDFRNLEEKVFESRIVLRPPPDHAVGCIIEPGNREITDWLTRAATLKLNTIRVLERARHCVSQVRNAVGAPLHPLTDAQVVSACILFCASKFGGPNVAPDLSFLRSVGWATRADPKKLDDKQAAWLATLDKYGWGITDELDLELMATIEDGYPHRQRLAEEIARKTRVFENAEAQAALEAAWRPYHDSFRTDEDAFCRGVMDAYRKHMSSVTPLTLDSAARLLRELGRPTEANELIDKFVEAHKDDAESLDLGRHPFGSEIRDQIFRGRLEDLVNGVPRQKDITEVLTRIAKNQSWGSTDRAFLAQQPPEIYEALFRQHEGDDLSRIVKAALMFGRFGNADESDKNISANATEALKRIGSESKFRARQIEKFGIRIEGREP